MALSLGLSRNHEQIGTRLCQGRGDYRTQENYGHDEIHGVRNSHGPYGSFSRSKHLGLGQLQCCPNSHCSPQSRRWADVDDERLGPSPRVPSLEIPAHENGKRGIPLAFSQMTAWDFDEVHGEF